MIAIMTSLLNICGTLFVSFSHVAVIILVPLFVSILSLIDDILLQGKVCLAHIYVSHCVCPPY